MTAPVTAFEYVDFDERCKLPSTSGVYAACKKQSDVLYIGQSKDLKTRWKGSAHHQYISLAMLGCTRIYYHPLPCDQLKDRERVLIEQYNPPLNASRVAKQKGKDIGKMLRQIILKDLRKESLAAVKAMEAQLYTNLEEKLKDDIRKEVEQELISKKSAVFDSRSMPDNGDRHMLALHYTNAEEGLISVLAGRYGVTPTDILSKALVMGLKELSTTAFIEIR